MQPLRGRHLPLAALLLAAATTTLTTARQCPVPSSAWRERTCAPCRDGSKTCSIVAKVPAADADMCCSACSDNRLCTVWTYNPTSDAGMECHLKTALDRVDQGNCTTGFSKTPPAPAPSPPTPGPANHSRPNVLFLMCDSMDGRVLDPSSPVYQRLQMPNLRKLAARGVNFVNTYAASPQCVPSRTTMFTGRRTDQVKTWSNGQGVAGVPSSGTLDTVCLADYDEETCAAWQREQNVTATLLDSLRLLQYEMHLYGKVDVGAGILNDPDETNATCDGYHGGPTLDILTRTADIRRATKADPLKITNDQDNNVHAEDWKMLPKCVEFLKSHATEKAAQAAGSAASASTLGSFATSWVLYCSINIPHPAFDTNATWLSYVNNDKVEVPEWIPTEQFHPADSYMSISKSVWRNFSDAEILKVRRTYYAMCAETDYMLGLVLDALTATGQR